MVSNRAIIFAEGEPGGTFIDWSLLRFSNIKTFYNPLSNTVNDVVDNPLSGKNAHAHNKIHPKSIEELRFCITALETEKQFYSIFAYPGLIPGETFRLNDFLRDQNRDHENKWIDYYKKTKESHRLFQEYLLENNLKTLIIRENKKDQLYNFFNQGRAFGTSAEDEIKKFYVKFFGDNKQNWQNFQHWDLREDLALSIRPFDSKYQIDISLPENLLYEISYTDLFDNLDLHIESILDFFNISVYNIDERWKEIYQSWRKVHDLKFHRDWKIIIDNIVNGRDFDLSGYNMDFVKDIFIQHILIYKYNLNIKGYDITRFPLNTKLIYDLLETNMHSVDISYCETIKNV